ncbi:hypothetical protein EPN18_01830 [bacterium]|nr:MAG: hypothetical protein EPN18_01830 [bacterium]
MKLLISILQYVPVTLASIGLIIATSSFISGLQLIRGTSITIEGRIHRLNGYLSIILYVILAVLGFALSGISLWSVFGWFSGFFIILTKLWIVKKSRKKRRAFKYVSWFGASLTLMWLYMVYIHLPL